LLDEMGSDGDGDDDVLPVLGEKKKKKERVERGGRERGIQTG